MKTILFRCVGILLFFYLILWVVDMEKMLSALRSINPWVLLAIIPLHLLQWALRAWRWQILLASTSIRFSFWQSFALITSSFFFGCLTPGRMGEFAKVKFLMNAGHSFRSAFMNTLIERLLDILTLFVYVVIGVWIGQEWIPEPYANYTLAFIMVCTGGVIFFLVRRKLAAFLLSKIPETIAQSIDEKVRIWTHSLRSITVSQWCFINFYSILIWGLNYLMIYLLFIATEFTLPLSYAFAFTAFGSLAGLVPATVYGVGIRESLLIGLFLLTNHPHPREAAILFGLMYYVLLIYHIGLGLIGWLSPWMKPFIEKSQESDFRTIDLPPSAESKSRHQL